MALPPIFIPGKDPEEPNCFGLKIHYIVGGTEEFEVAGRWFIKDNQMLEIVTTEDIWHDIPYSSIRRLEWDKRFSKIHALNEKKRIQADGQKNSIKAV